MWFPLCNYTHYSLLRGYSKPNELALKCKENDFPACGIADYHSMSGAVKFFKSCKAVGVKPIIGCSFDGFRLFAKNLDGWYDLIQIVSSIRDDVVDKDVIQDRVAKGNLFCIADAGSNPPSYKYLDLYQKNPGERCFQTSFYTNPEDAELHRVCVCTGLKVTMRKAKELVKEGDHWYNKFFDSENTHTYHIPTKEEADRYNYPHEILQEIYDMCEDYNILSDPKLPHFPTPNKETEQEYLKELARDGWRSKLGRTGKATDADKREEYHQRFLHEFSVIEEADLFGYFLIVQDIIRHCHKQGWDTGPGRGSAAGCLISYLLGITDIDPIQYGLYFSRFYNHGRNIQKNVSFPELNYDEFKNFVYNK